LGEVWRVAPGVWWAVETDGIVLGGPGAGSARALAYPEAAVWDLLSRGYRMEKVASMMEGIASLPPAAAKRIVAACLRTWVGAGVLVEATAHG